MNESLVTYDGGQDVYADDLSFMQENLRSMINSAIRQFGDRCILWGCLDSNKQNVIEGAVIIGGKLYQVPALGEIGSQRYLCFREVLYDERTFEDNQKHNVKLKYEAYLSAEMGESDLWIDLKSDYVWKEVQVVGENLSGSVKYRIDIATKIAIMDITISADGQYNNSIGKYMFKWPDELNRYNRVISTSVLSGQSMNYKSEPVTIYNGNVYDSSGPRSLILGDLIQGTFLLTKN